jgi:hypothetical protein
MTHHRDEDGYLLSGIATLKRLWLATKPDGTPLLSPVQIANRMGRTADGVTAKAAALGLPVREVLDDAPRRSKWFPGAAPERVQAGYRGALPPGNPLARVPLPSEINQGASA